MSKFKTVVLLGLLACGAAASAQEAAVIGYVKTAEPDAVVVLAGTATKAEPGTALLRGALLRTGKTGSVGVMLQDNTRLSIGPDTELAIDDYAYAPGTGDLKLGASITKGTLHYVSGVIAKLKPEAVSVKTPTGTIGVRGTRFVVKVDAPAP